MKKRRSTRRAGQLRWRACWWPVDRWAACSPPTSCGAQGHDVMVLEKAAGTLDGRGAGIVTHAPLLEALAPGRHTHRRHAGRAGAVAGCAQCGRLGGGTNALPQLLTSWGRLYHLLRQALPAERYRHGATVQRVTQEDGRVQVHCARRQHGRRRHAGRLRRPPLGRAGAVRAACPAVLRRLHRLARRLRRSVAVHMHARQRVRSFRRSRCRRASS